MVALQADPADQRSLSFGGDYRAILTLTGKTGWREVEIGRGSSDTTCPVHALEQYLHYAKIDFGPLFQRVTRDLPLLCPLQTGPF